MKQITFVCSCKTCVEMCRHNTCRPTPREASALIEMGHAGKFMVNYWDAESRFNQYVEYLQPANVGFACQKAPWIPDGECLFLENGLCTIHESGYKPVEARRAMHAPFGDSEANFRLRLRLVKMWATPRGKALVERWKQIVNYYNR